MKTNKAIDMNFDFSTLPATNQEAFSVVWNKRVTITVPSVETGDASQLIHSQEEGERYIQKFNARFASIDEMNQWREKYQALKLKWCNDNTSV